MFTLTVTFGQYETLNISRPFDKGNFTITTVVVDNEINQLHVTKINEGGECFTNGELFITFNDRTYLVLNESETTTNDCGNVVFNITPEQSKTLMEFSMMKIAYKNQGENKSVAGTVGNSWYFTNYIRTEIDKNILNQNL